MKAPRSARATLATGAVVVRSASELRYALGPDPHLERPGHVRAGSALVVLGDELCVVQDDTLWLALVRPDTALVRAVPLPARGGVRTFDARRGNKPHKPDFEAAFVHEGTLYALGSGSTPAREGVLVIERAASDAPVARIVQRPAWYAALRAERDFAGSELNVEGSVIVGDRLVLAQRGNGARGPGRDPVSATAEIDVAALVRHVHSDSEPVPGLERITRWDLGGSPEAPLTFTDLAVDALGRVRYLAVAEASPDTYHDGVVSQVALGTLDLERGVGGYVVLPTLTKLEGLACHGGTLYAVSDRDDPDAPSELVTLVER